MQWLGKSVVCTEGLTVFGAAEVDWLGIYDGRGKNRLGVLGQRKGRLAGCLVVPEGRFDWRFGATEGRIDWEFGPWTAEWSKGLGLAEGGLNGGTLEGFGVEDLGRQRLKSARNLGRLRVQSV
ncbi:hypothetical protein Acr_24g0007860 [Actinidia rufa]|uniref:Uncharacterized protein n=1 Tax=Actinidia rufa TaxID=165716 RepID=A0A7J0GUY4_9ERIC|nr:hypothetical protein Acr_24g0007860 [Actinidia rufa]